MKTELQNAFQILLAYRGHDLRGDLPQIVHELSILRRVSNWGVKDVPTLKLCMYHDLFEDTTCKPADLADVEGEEMAALVTEMTFRPKGDAESGKDYQAYKQWALADYQNKSVESLVVKLADRLCNVEDFMGEKSDYAPKYFRYANGLFDAITKRSDEIGSKYGAKVLLNIFIDLNRFKVLFPDGGQ